jgi:hypothetical protein
MAEKSIWIKGRLTSSFLISWVLAGGLYFGREPASRSSQAASSSSVKALASEGMGRQWGTLAETRSLRRRRPECGAIG